MSIAAVGGTNRAAAAPDGWRWGASLLVALALHLLAALALLSWRGPSAPAVPIAAPILLELEAPVAPPAPVAAPAPPPPPKQPEAVQPIVPPVPVPAPKPPEPRHPRVTPQPTPRPAPTPPVETTAPAEQPAPVPVVPASAPAAPTPAPQAMARFEDMLAAHLDRFKRYPPMAQRRGEQGVAYLRFTMDRQGHVLAYRLERSSGHSALDEEVSAMIRRAEPLPPIPDIIPQSQIEIIVPVRFALR